MASAKSKDKPIKVLCYTWNVGNAEPDEAELAHWLPENGGDYGTITNGSRICDKLIRVFVLSSVLFACGCPDSENETLLLFG